MTSQDDARNAYLTASEAVLNDTYGDTRSRDSVLVADGHGVRVHVWGGHLQVDDGLGDHRRTRRLTRSQRTVTRLVILAGTGSLSLEAIRWCADTGIVITCARHDGALDLLNTPATHADARLRRAQALATDTSLGVDIGRTILTLKISGHQRVMKRLDADAGALDPYLDRIDRATTLTELLDAESRAAAHYYSSWAGRVRVTFARRVTGTPEHWATFNGRRSRLGTTRTNRAATDPVNALLNYGYSLGEVESRIALAAVGLDPALGILHRDRSHRDSFALDLLETIRPVIDETVLDLVARRPFGPVDFIETSEGSCRLTESVTHPLSRSMTRWAIVLGPIVEAIAGTLADNAEGKVGRRTPLTNLTRVVGAQPGRKRRSQARAAALAATAHVARLCEHCGRALTGRARKVCVDCRPEQRRKHLAEARTVSHTDLWRERMAAPEVRAKRAESIAANRAALSAWTTENGAGENLDRAAYLRDVATELVRLPTATIAQELGISRSAALRIRTGKLVPHVRHWATLTRMVDRAAQ